MAESHGADAEHFLTAEHPVGGGQRRLDIVCLNARARSLHVRQCCSLTLAWMWVEFGEVSS